MAMTTGERRRDHDAIEIPGDYQARAIESPRAAQRFWHAAKLRLIDRVAPARPTARIADAGCGSGVITAHLATRARAVVGFDVNPAAVAFASSAFARPNTSFVLGPFERIVDQGPFDQIYSLEVIEHLYHEQAIATLRLFAQAAAPGAELFLTTPNAHSAWPLIEWTLDRLHLVPTLDEAQHLTAFSKQTLAAACTLAGWDVVEIGTFNGFAPFLAPLSEGLATAMEQAEFRTRRVLPWNLLYCRAIRQAGSGQV